MNFKKTNVITGWVICLVACTVYIMTSEAGGSLWDCGEFVSSCFKVQIPHPPGAPLFVLIGRIFIVLFGDNPLTAAKGVNVMSALASGFTILFLFWTITHFARKMVQIDAITELTKAQVWTIMGAGIIGSLAYTFCDSFWYSAVEGEVYAMSSFFTAIVFWAILKWENAADEPGADKWIVFIFFMIGLSIGVHLLCLLTIPAIVMAYYFRKREQFNYKNLRKYFIWMVVVGGVLAFIAAAWGASGERASLEASPYISQLKQQVPDLQLSDSTVSGLMVLGAALCIGLLYLVERINKAKKEYYGGAYMFFVIGFVLLGIVQVGVIQYSIKAAGQFDIFFVNNVGMPFFSGFVFFFVLVAILMWIGLRIANKKGWSYLRLAIWSVAFTLIGYSTYVTTMIRSNADPAVDMYNVDNPESLVGYLARDQYGDFPILYGQKFNAPGINYRETSNIYQKGKDKYEYMGKNGYVVYLPKDKMIFPRMWDASNDQGHADYYANFLGAGKNQQGDYDLPKDEEGFYTRPDMMDNLKFFISYQNYFMYFRYFMWNFSGKQNDIEGTFTGNVRDGNWITGIGPVDNALYGDQSLMPDSLQTNKAHNSLFMLPFVLGIIGMFYHFKKKGGDALVNFLLFFFTGFAIVIYLNQPGFQPRERDYAYVGSFYAFAVWIGLAVSYIVEIASNWSNQKLLKSMLYAGGYIAAFFVAGGLVSSIMSTDGNAAGGIAFGVAFAAIYALLAGGLPYLLKSIGNKQSLALAATVLTLAIPVWMGAQEWDDHDRSHKELARDLAKDYLESCAPNAILFTFGDNDTYPLWYAQEVEGIRPDIRVINTSLLGIDWYINQLRYKVNKSDPIDVIWSAEQIQGQKRNIVYFQPNTQFPDNTYYDLYSMMKDYVGSDAADRTMDRGGDDKYNTFPAHKVSVPVDSSLVRTNGTVNADDIVDKELRFQIPSNGLQKNDLAILNIIAANKWKRPIYFTMPYNSLGFQNYIRRDGLSYRLVPVQNSQVNTDWMMKLEMDPTKYSYGNANLPGVYFDEENRRHLNDMREADATLALDLASKNRKDDAKKILDKSDKMLLQDNFPYGQVSRGNDHNRTTLLFLQACYMADDKALATKVYNSVKTDLQQQMKYYNSLNEQRANNMSYEKNIAQDLLNMLDQLQKMYNPSTQSPAEKGTLNDSALKPADTAPHIDTAHP